MRTLATHHTSTARFKAPLHSPSVRRVGRTWGILPLSSWQGFPSVDSPGQLRTLSLVAISMYPTRVRETTPLAIKDQSHPARVPLQQEGSRSYPAVVALPFLLSSSRTLQLRRTSPLEPPSSERGERDREKETETGEPPRTRWEI